MRNDPTLPVTLRATRSPIRRLVAGLWLAVFALFTAGIPVLDAAVGHAADVVAHWEEAGDDCPPQHDPATCQLCQVHASARRGEPGPLVAPVAVAFTVAPPEAILLAEIDADQGGIPASRGPPVG